MIFHDHKTIFMHVGKTAGTSIEEMLDPAHGLDAHIANRDRLFGLDKELGIYLHHATARTTRELLPKAIWQNYFKFSIVRNPFTRMVSTYYYVEDFHRERYGDFRGFVLALPELATREHHLAGSHYVPQTLYTHIDGEQVVDYVGRFENLDDAVRYLGEHLGQALALPRVNIREQASRPKVIADLYDEETIGIIQDVYAPDFDTFGYSKQLP
jgi:hypothetical protein